MTTSPGQPSVNAPRRSWSAVVDALVVLGILVSLGLISVSVVLNFRMGYRSADTAFDGWVYGLGVGFGDILKATAPFVLAWGWRHRDGFAVLASIAVFTLFSAYSLTAALGFAAQHRATKAADNRGQVERHADVRRALERAEARLAALGPQRSSAEIESHIAKELKTVVPNSSRTVGTISSDCTLNRTATRDACALIATLKQEKARADEHAQLTAASAAARHDLNTVASGAAPLSTDPQIDALHKIAQHVDPDIGRDQVEVLLAVMLAVLIELGSGVGLYMVTTPWRAVAAAHQSLPMTKAASATLEDYMLERLEPHASGEVTLHDLFKDYLAWTAWRGARDITKAEFARSFSKRAGEVGIRRVRRDRTDVYRQIAFVGG